MPWQQMVADVGLELLPGTMIPAYREVIVTVPRQNGKTTLMLSFEIQRCLGWGGPQWVAYTAQTGKDAKDKLLEQDKILRRKGNLVIAGLGRTFRGAGNESINFKNGSKILIVNSGEDAGHGKTVDLAVLDETFADVDDRREQALIPAMLTRPAAQLLNISTAGTESSAYLKRKVDAGRAAVANGERQGVAYFEWSADPDADIDDPATWWSCMPALGYTITEDVVRHTRKTTTEGDFRRACLNQWTVSEERVIPAALWNAVCAEDVAPKDRMVLAVDVNTDRTASSLAVADAEHRCELVEHREGTHWVAERAVELAKKWNMPVVLDGYGPAASLAAEISAAGVKVVSYSVKEIAQACGFLYDAVADEKISIRRNEALDIAAAAARRRITQDVWIWGRKDANADVSPLIALTLAFHQASIRPKDSEIWFAWD